MKLFLSAFCIAALLILASCSSALKELPLSADNSNLKTKLYSPDELKFDLDFLVKTIKEVHPELFKAVDSVAFINKERKVRAGLTMSMSGIEFVKLAAPLLAMLNDGHSGIYFSENEWLHYIYNNGRFFPYIITFNSTSGLTALASRDSVHMLMPGTRILKINGYQADSLFVEFTKYQGAEREDFKYKMASGIFDMYLWLHNINPPYEIICRYGSDQIKSFMTEGRVLPLKSPKAIQPIRPFNNYSFEILPENIGYLNYRLMRNDKENPFSQFLKNTFSELKIKHSKRLIVDLRKNGGGNSDFGKELLEYITDKPFRTSAKKIWRSSAQYKKYMREQIPWWAGWATYPPVIWIAGLFTDDTRMFTASDGECIELIREEETPGENPLRFNGRVCFLIGPGTFSAAVDLANAVGDYKLAELAGEETGGIPNSYGEVYNFVLPNTGIKGSISSACFVRANGNEKDMHGVLPDIEVRQSREDMARNYDTVLEAAKKWILE